MGSPSLAAVEPSASRWSISFTSRLSGKTARDRTELSVHPLSNTPVTGSAAPSPQNPNSFSGGDLADERDGFLGVVGSMRGDQDVVQLEQRVVRFPVPPLGRLFLEIIQSGTGDPSIKAS
jgi:hypothetical protein